MSLLIRRNHGNFGSSSARLLVRHDDLRSLRWPVFLRSHPCAEYPCFIFAGARVAQRRVASPRGAGSPEEQRWLEGAEEALRHAVVPAVAFATHAASDASCREGLSVRMAGAESRLTRPFAIASP